MRRSAAEQPKTEQPAPAAPVPAEAEARPVSWQKSRASQEGGACVEMAKLPGGEIVLRNSRQPGGPALIYTRSEIEALIQGAKDGDFDHLIQ
jgi:hypothetical protein